MFLVLISSLSFHFYKYLFILLIFYIISVDRDAILYISPSLNKVSYLILSYLMG